MHSALMGRHRSAVDGVPTSRAAIVREQPRGTTIPASVVALSGPVVIAGVVAVCARGYLPPDWTILHSAGRALLAGDVAVYGDHPAAQVGPLALVLSALPRPLFVTLVCTMLLGVTLAARRLGVPQEVILLGGSVAGVVWGLFAIGGHADDQLVVLGAALMAVGIAEDRKGMVGWGFLLALAGKPTGVVLAPLLLAAGWPTLLAAVAGAAVLWAPFVFIDLDGFLRAGRGIVVVEPWSTPFMLGEPAGAAFPEWVRPAQLLGGLVLCAVVARRNGPVAAVIAALAFRALLEPGAWPSYSNALIVLAVLLPARRRPLMGLAVGSWLAGWLLIATPGPVTGALHSGLLVGLVAAAAGLQHPGRPPADSGAPATPVRAGSRRAPVR